MEEKNKEAYFIEVKVGVINNALTTICNCKESSCKIRWGELGKSVKLPS